MKLTIIGAGPGGYETAVAAARQGIEVTIISDGPVGGTCLNEGCIPTKTFCRNAELLEDLQKGEVFGLEGLQYTFDFHKVIERKNDVVGQLRSGVEFLLGGKNITLVQGRAALKDAHTVVVDGTDYVSDYILLATGSYSASLPIPGKDLPGVITSKEILNLEEVPERLCIIGAGVIGLEFASIFKSFGSQVTVVEFCKNILPRFDTDLAKRLKQTLSKRGIDIQLSAQVQRIEEVPDNGASEVTDSDKKPVLRVTYTQKDKEFSVEADKVLMAVGRRPNVQSLDLDALGIVYSPKGIVVDKDMRTNVPSIFAIGDVTGGLMLAHVATFQGLKALSALMKENGLVPEVDGDKIDLSIVPAAVFTNPEAAIIGLSEDDCKDKGIPVKVLKSFFRANGKALSMDEPDGFCKIIVADSSKLKTVAATHSETQSDSHPTLPSAASSEAVPTSVTGPASGPDVLSQFGLQEGQILGCHLFGAHAADLIQEVSVLMNQHGNLADFRSVIHAHPTLGEVVQSALHS